MNGLIRGVIVADGTVRVDLLGLLQGFVDRELLHFATAPACSIQVPHLFATEAPLITFGALEAAVPLMSSFLSIQTVAVPAFEFLEGARTGSVPQNESGI